MALPSVLSPPAGASDAARLDFAVGQAIELQRKTNELKSLLGDEREARQRAEGRLNVTIAETADTARRELATAQAGGLRMETWGLFLAALGTVLGLIGGL